MNDGLIWKETEGLLLGLPGPVESGELRGVVTKFAVIEGDDAEPNVEALQGYPFDVCLPQKFGRRQKDSSLSSLGLLLPLTFPLQLS